MNHGSTVSYSISWINARYGRLFRQGVLVSRLKDAVSNSDILEGLPTALSVGLQRAEKSPLVTIEGV